MRGGGGGAGGCWVEYKTAADMGIYSPETFLHDVCPRTAWDKHAHFLP
jgi:hypothetical protein